MEDKRSNTNYGYDFLLEIMNAIRIKEMETIIFKTKMYAKKSAALWEARYNEN